MVANVDIYTGPASCLIVNTVSTSDASGAAQQNTIELITISDAVYTGCGTARHDKSPTVNCCSVLFMRY